MVNKREEKREIEQDQKFGQAIDPVNTKEVAGVH